MDEPLPTDGINDTSHSEASIIETMNASMSTLMESAEHYKLHRTNQEELKWKGEFDKNEGKLVESLEILAALEVVDGINPKTTQNLMRAIADDVLMRVQEMKMIKELYMGRVQKAKHNACKVSIAKMRNESQVSTLLSASSTG